MSATPSTMLPLGTRAPEFSLPDAVSGKNVKLANLSVDKGLLVMFICNHCPYVLHILNELVSVSREYQQQGITFVAISSNDAEAYPADSPGKMKELAEERNFPFSYLYDESQDIARAYQAACTPDFFLFNGNRELVYRGQFDASRPKNDAPVNGKDMRNALDALIEGKTISTDQTPSIGCNIKWKSA